MREFSGSRMSRAERGDADPHEESGVVSVQAALLHHAIRDIARRLTAIESIAYLMTRNDRGLSGCERDPLGLQRIQEVGVDGIGTRAGRGYCHHTERGEHQG
jgi:hypothetical protein